MKRPSIFTPPPRLTRRVVGIVVSFFLCIDVFLSAQEYVWTGGGADSFFTTPENWGGTGLFTNNNYGLTHNNNNASITAILPAGYDAQINGFDITNATVVVEGKLDSIRGRSDGFSFNGFWMRGNSAITLLPHAEFAFLNQSGNPDSAQLTMARGNNLVNKSETSSLSFGNIFISTYDCDGGYSNIFNQFAGAITSNSIQLGTYTNTTDFSEDPSQYNLYDGTVSTSLLRIQYDSSRTSSNHGRGEVNIYGGEFTVGTLSGGQSVSGGTTYFGDINIHLSGKTANGFGTFEVTGDSDYNGHLNVTVDAPLLTLSPDILETALVNFGGNVHTDMQLTSNSSLITFSEESQTARLDAAKNLTPDGGYTVGTALSLAETATEGYLSISASDNPYLLLLSTTEFGSDAEMDLFVDWLNESTENYHVTAMGLSALQLGTFSPNADSVFLWDFSGYSANVGVLGITSQQVPEPHTWILALLGIAFYGGKYYAQKRIYVG